MCFAALHSPIVRQDILTRKLDISSRQIIATSNNLHGLSHAQQDRFDQIKMPPVSAEVCEERVRQILEAEGAQVDVDHLRGMLSTTNGSWRDIGSVTEDMVLDSKRKPKP